MPDHKITITVLPYGAVKVDHVFGKLSGSMLCVTLADLSRRMHVLTTSSPNAQITWVKLP